jgi:hypothetical protein
MVNLRIAAALFLGTLACALPAAAQQGDSSAAKAVVTVLPKKGEVPEIRQNDLKVKVDGKDGTITGWEALRNDRAGLELVVLIDDSARSSIGVQLSDLQSSFNRFRLRHRWVSPICRAVAPLSSRI